MTVPYSLVGADATVIFKLWDVAPGETKTLVTRGVYRITATTDLRDSPLRPAGVLTTKLFGNDYRFDPGHQFELEVSQTDAPFLRPDNLPSTITFTAPQITLPILEEFTVELVAP